MIRRIAMTAVLAVGTVLATQENAKADWGVRITTPNVSFRVGSGHHHHGPYVPYPAYRPVVVAPAPVVVAPAPVVVPATVPSYGVGYPTYRPATGFVVEYRRCAHDPWQFYGFADCRDEAFRMERHLERNGYHARFHR